jgi:hypothetical protein
MDHRGRALARDWEAATRSIFSCRLVTRISGVLSAQVLGTFRRDGSRLRAVSRIRARNRAMTLLSEEIADAAK